LRAGADLGAFSLFTRMQISRVPGR
jgi:hypothetical protein